MPTIRGFVERLEIGRAGLATVALLHDDGTRANYVIPDLDADPERFNERLSKLAVLRDAQNRAEPVEVEYLEGEGGRTIERVARITRDALDPPGATDTVRVMIVGLVVVTGNQTGAQAETADIAQVITFGENGAGQTYILNLQVPERGVAEAQLELIRAAQASGETITLLVDAKTRRITGVWTGSAAGAMGDADLETIDGFVESIAHTSTVGGLAGMALVEFTTAPPFTDAAQVVALIPFVPRLHTTLLVVLGSPEYELFLTGLRKKLRMSVSATTLRGRGTADDGMDHPTGGNPDADTPTTGLRVSFHEMAAAATGGDHKSATMALVRGAKLLHALASASRPVWVQISRKSLDVGPDAACTDGLPSNDLTPRGLRDLHIPYTAEWVGWGCFNHGVYRFQFDLKTPLKIYVDGKLLCVHASEDGATQFAHACLDCEHEVRVVLTDWTCEQDFLMDVYRIR